MFPTVRCTLRFAVIAFSFVPLVYAQWGTMDNNHQRVWWSRFAADSRPVGKYGSLSRAASKQPQSQENHASSNSRQYDTKDSWSAPIRYQSSQRASRVRPFRFEDSWTDSQESKTFENQAWKSNSYDYDDGSDSWYQNKLDSQTCQCESRIKNLEDKVNELFIDNDRLGNHVWNAIDMVESITSNKGRVSGNYHLPAPQKQIISFSAQAGFNLPYLKDEEILVFDEVLVNNGGAYDPHNGVFTSPVDGVYLFSATILSGFNATIETMITLNGQEVSRLYSGSFGNRGSGTNVVVLNLREGDKVAVSVFYGNGNYVHGKWSTFAGSLLSTY